VTRVVQHEATVSRTSVRAGSDVLALGIALLLSVIAIQSAQAQKATVLYSFTGLADGAYPYVGLIQGSHGFYGTTSSGGVVGLGTVFHVNRSGGETVLYSFSGGADGGEPYAALVSDSAGNLYGTTSAGGAQGEGTVFKVDTTGTETVLYNFSYSDGSQPSGGVIRDATGNLYGTTTRGGSSAFGTVFKIDTSGTETVLHNFAGGATDGAFPYLTRLKIDKAGNLYGVTQEGGGSNLGVVFEISASGTFSMLHSFAGGPTDGAFPSGPLLRDTAGNLRGTTENGGTSNLGTVFELGPTGTLTVLHSFAGGATDGSYPYGGLVQDRAGNFYGTATGGGTFGHGTIYKLTKTGTLILLHSLQYQNDGAYPYGGLLRDATGHLFGTALQGGGGRYGTVFELTP
jgi:uncharacterized repeat protein (TIGR03803 family)